MNPNKQRDKIKKALQDAYYAMTRKEGQKAIKKYEKASKKLAKGTDKEQPQ